ncbi:MAG: hypothetical protein GY795_16090 [Desulfobacterales bacterium]|nr:hypothetical protein [Desulfobacterales bacterium]
MKYILPGMGANSKMYSGPWHELGDCCFIDWPPYDQEKSIADVAIRLIEKYQINQNDIAIGSSLGGMVGSEIGCILGLKQIFLIGSAVSSNEISFLSKLLMPFASKPVVKISQSVSSFSNAELHQMYSKAEPDFIVSVSKAIMNWEGFKGDLKTVIRIHGRKDFFINCPDNCEVIEGGHLIAITHARECVDIVNILKDNS